MAYTLRVPELGESVDNVEVVSVLIAVGDILEAGQSVIEVETEKASVEVPVDVAGTVTQVHVSAGDNLETGAPILSMDEDEAIVVEAAEPEPEPEPTAAPELDPASPRQQDREHLAPTWTADPGPLRLVPAAPSVRRFAREVGVDVTQVKGTGPGGRLSIDDVKAHARAVLEARGAAAVEAPPPLPDFSRWGAVEEIQASKVRRATADRMTRAWRLIPQVTNHEHADITRLEKVRRDYRARVEAAGGRLTLTAILVKVVAAALKVFPNLNSSLDSERNIIIRKSFVNIGVAVDSEYGLLVPVLRDADAKNITEIAVELDDLAGRARERKLQPVEMEGATFTISNLGGIGGSGFSPIVNWPEAAILGVSRGSMTPVWNGEDFEPRLMLPLSLTYDHRLVDGADAARFLRWLADAMEEPLLLALEG